MPEPWKASVVHRLNAVQPVAGKSRAPSNSRRRFVFETALLASRGCLAAAGTLKPLLYAFLALCSCDGTAQHGDGSRGNVEGRHGGLPPEDLRRAAKEQRGEFLFSMTTGDMWRRTLLSNDSGTQLVASGLVRAVAQMLDEATLLHCVERRTSPQARTRSSLRVSLQAHDGPYWPVHTVFSFP